MKPPQSPLEKLTFTGRMLLLGHLLLFVGGSILYVCDAIPRLPAGRYPLLLFIVPVGIGCLFSFLILTWLLERAGVKIYKR
jgi:hypothetical protein